jgi:signal transduction histidine kinase
MTAPEPFFRFSDWGRKWLVWCVWLVLSQTMAAQAPPPDFDAEAAKISLAGMPEDTNKLQVLKQLVLWYFKRSPVEMQHFAERYLELAEKMARPGDAADGHNYLGVSLSMQSKRQQAIVQFLEAENGFRALGKKRQLGQVYMNMAGLYRSLYKFDKSLLTLYEARKVFTELKDTNLYVANEIAIGKIFQVISRRHWMEKKITLSRSYADTAHLYYQKAIHFTGPKEPMTRLLAWLGESWYYVQIGQYKEGYHMADTAYRFILEQQLPMHLPNASLFLGQAAFGMGNHAEAVRWLQQSIESSRQYKNVETELMAMQQMAETHAAMGDFARAYRYLNEYNGLADSLNAAESRQAIEDVEAGFAQQLMLAEKNSLQQANDAALSNNRKLSVLLLVLILAFAGSVMLYLRLRQNEKRLDALNRSKDKFFSILAHDLRGPIGSITGLTNKVDYLIKSGQMERLYRLGEQVDFAMLRLRDTLDNLLVWARSQQYQLTYHPEVFLLDEQIQKAQRLYSASAEHKGLSFETAMPEKPLAHADVNSVELILRNLINNAVKFSHPGGTIRLSVDSDGEYWRISVRDHGRGMSAEKLRELFSREVNASDPGTLGEKGTGLGLILCRQIARLGEFDFGAESVPDQGTTVFFRLKKAGPHAAA